MCLRGSQLTASVKSNSSKHHRLGYEIRAVGLYSIKQAESGAFKNRTTHLPLGFSPPVPGGAKNAVEHQFLNVGWAVHPEVVQGFLKANGVKFAVT